MQRYSLTLCTFERGLRFTTRDVVDPARSQLLQNADDFQCAIPAYCFMPDHLHILAVGESDGADLEAFMYKMKQKTGFDFKQARRAGLWQPGFYDRILRSDQQTLVVARYILENPVRAGLVARFDEYPFSGSNRYTMKQLADIFAMQDVAGRKSCATLPQD
jgi:putative transposase